MKKLAAFLCISSLFVFAGAANAQTYDHLKCYKVKDSAKAKAIVDLTPEQIPPFQVGPGCKMVVKGKEFCVPADKFVVDTDAPGQAPYPTDGVVLQRDYICYKVKCPKVDTPDTEVSDQFATRTMSKFKVSKLCVPAVKTCQGSEAPTCGGVCPFGDPCVDSGGTCICF